MPVAPLITQIMLLACASGQEFTQVQSFTSRVLFSREDAAAEARAAERRRIEDLNRRTQEQAGLLQQQAQSVRLLDEQVQKLTNERQVTEAANAFDAALMAGDQTRAQSLLERTIVVDADGEGGVAPNAMSNLDFLNGALASSARGNVVSRWNQTVEVNGDHATLTANGFQWGQTKRVGPTGGRRAGTYRYTFARTPAGWKLDGFIFSPAASLDLREKASRISPS